MSKIWTPEDGLSDTEDFDAKERAKGMKSYEFECRYGKVQMKPDEMSPANQWCNYLTKFVYNNGLVINEYVLVPVKAARNEIQKHVEDMMNDKEWRDYKVEQPNIVRDRNEQEKKIIEKEMNDGPEN